MWIYCPSCLLSNIVLCVLSLLCDSISESLVHVTVVAGPPVEIQVNTESIILNFDMLTSPRMKECVCREYYCLETEGHYNYINLRQNKICMC